MRGPFRRNWPKKKRSSDADIWNLQENDGSQQYLDCEKTETMNSETNQLAKSSHIKSVL